MNKMRKKWLPELSSVTVKSVIFIILVAIALAFWLYLQEIFFKIREFQESVVETHVGIYMAIIDPQTEYDSGINTQLFDSVVRGAPFPSIFTDENFNPIQELWHNVGIEPHETSDESKRKLAKLIKKMDKVNPPKPFTMPAPPKTITDTLTVYEKSPGAALPVLLRGASGEMLYSRNINADLSDTLIVRSLLDRLDDFSQVLLFEEKGKPYLEFHGYRSQVEWPIIIARSDSTPIYWYNTSVASSDTTASGKEKLASLMAKMKQTGNVYTITADYNIPVNRTWLFHYGDLPFLMLIGWMPLIELLVIMILLSIGFIGFKNIKNAEQRSIWVGMAKETAHQLGTPISSLNGWLELLKAGVDEKLLEQALPDMEYDVQRLTRVAERFSSVGSKPELKPINVSDVVNEVLDYYRARVPRMGRSVVIEGHCDGLRVVMGNLELLNWAFENLVKNSLNAIDSGDGKITVTGSGTKDFREVILDFIDNGKGIPSSLHKKIMQPGFTTKKRGWGLGLNLVKRIIEDYHGGKLFLLESKPGTGTTFRVVLPAMKK